MGTFALKFLQAAQLAAALLDGGKVVGYGAKQTIEYDSWARSDVEARIERLFQIGPFGHQEFAPVPPAAAVSVSTLLPMFKPGLSRSRR